MKKIIIIALILCLALASTPAFAIQSNETALSVVGTQAVSSAVSDKDPQMDADITLTDDDVSLNRNESANYEEFKDGLVDKLCKANAADYVDTINDYVSENKNILAQKIAEAIIEADSDIKKPVVEIDDSLAKGFIDTIEIDEFSSITFTPGFLYLDEIEIKNDVIHQSTKKPELLQALQDFIVTKAYAASTKYIDVATRRTLFVTSPNGDYTFDVASVHTGGEISYDGSKAKHSSGYYAYSEVHKPLIKVGQVQKWNEASSGTSWHYKMLGVVSGEIKSSLISFTIVSKAVSCEVIVNKTGAVTKKYVPAL